MKVQTVTSGFDPLSMIANQKAASDNNQQMNNENEEEAKIEIKRES